jgi:hypothetical protein
MRSLLIIMLIVLSIGSGFPVESVSAESGWNEIGVRTGFQVSSRFKYFRQYDAFAVYGLPWDWRWASGWGLAPTANVSLGILNGGDHNEFIGSVGTAIVLNKPEPGFSADFGLNANILNRRHFGGQDFGSLLQFGAYLGVNYQLNNGIKIGYRLQHISNGHIFYPNGTPNPGLDEHIIGVSYVF